MKRHATTASGVIGVRARRSVRLLLVTAAVFAGAGGYAQQAFAATQIHATPRVFGSGQKVLISGEGFAPFEVINVWYDGNDNGTQELNEPATVATADAQGNFSAPTITLHGPPQHHGFRAGSEVPPDLAETMITIGSCWFNDCMINGRDTVCLIGNSPDDTLSDCKVLDSSYSDASSGYNLSDVGPRFAGAGVLAALVNDLGLPGSGCIAMNAAIIAAQALGNDVPNVFNLDFNHPGLTNIACGFPVPYELATYILRFDNHGPDAAFDDARVILNAALLAMGALGGPLSPPVIALQQLVAQAAVAGAIACGHVDYFCNGLDITFNILLKNTLQPKVIPLFVPGLFGKRWGDIIGWAMPVCFGGAENTLPPKDAHDNYLTGICEQGSHPRAVPGSAGPNNSSASIACATGTVTGMSIGYDGDISLDVNDGPTYGPGDINPDTHLPYPPGTLKNPLAPGPGVAPLTNYHNFLPGPGGSDAPGGIDIEIPRFDMARFLPQILVLRTGMKVNVCGRWVADMHQLWNELHPVISLVITNASSGSSDQTPPAVVPNVTGTQGQNDWYTSDVTVSWDFSDAQSPVTSHTGCVTTTITADTPGQTLSCTATSDGGTTTQDVTIKRDATAPSIGHVIDPASPDAAGGGWYTIAPTISFSCSDTGGSGLESCLANGTSSASATLGESSSAQTVVGFATDNAGNVSEDSVSGLLVDLSDPTISVDHDGSANAAGWFNTAVHFTFTCADAISGVATCPAAVDLAEGAEQSVSGTVTDNAGRSASTSVSHINIDTTKPLVTFSGNAGIYTVDQAVLITCTATDALSGIATDTCANIAGPAWSFGVGVTSRTATATDVAGNTRTSSTSFTVIVTAASLDALIRRFFGGDQNGANGLIAKVNAIINAPNANAKSGKLGAFDNQVDAKTGKPLTIEQAALLKQLAAAL